MSERCHSAGSDNRFDGVLCRVFYELMGINVLLLCVCVLKIDSIVNNKYRKVSLML